MRWPTIANGVPGVLLIATVGTAVLINRFIPIDFSLVDGVAAREGYVKAAEATLATFDYGIALAGALLIGMSIGLRDKAQQSERLGTGLACCVGVLAGALASVIYLGIFGRVMVTRFLAVGSFDPGFVEAILLIQILYLALGFILLFGAGIAILRKN